METRYIPLGDSDKITAGEDIVAIRNPAGLQGTVSKGIISGIRRSDGIKFIQITAPISPGSSGGPVFNLSGEVIGVATAYLDIGQNLNFAMPINYIKSLEINKKKLASLKKTTIKKKAEDTSLVKVVDVHYNQCGTSLCNIDFSLQNGTGYPIRNIQLFFIYKKYYNEYAAGAKDYADELLRQGKYDEWRKEMDKIEPIKEWYEMISYSTFKIKDTILPKLGLQFSHEHIVKYFYTDSIPVAEVEIRILDYEIVRTPGAAPEDLLLK